MGTWRWVATLGWAAAVGSAGCAAPAPAEDTAEDAADEVVVAGDIVVEPGAVAFGDVALGEEAATTVRIVNAGFDALEIRTLVGEGDAFAISAISTVLVAPGGEATVTVTFAPVEIGVAEGSLTVTSSDPDEGTVTIPLDGSGVGSVPTVWPAVVDLGEAGVGCTVAREVRVGNVGSADLVVEALGLEDPGGTLGAEAGVLPVALAPGEEMRAFVTWSPVVEGPLAGVLTVTTDGGELRVPIEGTAVVTRTQTDAWTIPEVAAIDVLFAADARDDDPTALAAVERLRADAATLVAALDASGADWRLAGVVADDGCVAGDVGWIDASLSAAERDAAWRAMLDPALAEMYADAGFTVLDAALSAAALGAGGCNEGLLREEAGLALVGLATTWEQSANPWSYYVSTFQGLKADPDRVVVSAIAGDYPSGCGDAAAGDGWYEASVATDGVFFSVCSTDWSGAYERIVEASVPEAPDAFELTQWPVEGTIVVYVDGVPVDGWHYNGTDNTVEFEDGSEPEAGATVEVVYAVADCDQ